MSHIANAHIIEQENQYFHKAPIVDGIGRAVDMKPVKKTRKNNGKEEPADLSQCPTTTHSGSPQNPFQSRLEYVDYVDKTYLDLVDSVKNNRLDIFDAGKAIHEAYGRNDPTVAHQIDRFVTNYAVKVVGSDMPPPTPNLHPHYLYIMTHGYGIVSQLALSAAKVNAIKPEQETLNLGEITGAACNIDDSLDFKYPPEPPFCGNKIDLRVEMPRKRNEAAHIVIKKIIYTLLGRACTIPTDIQSIHWSIPDDTIGSRSINPQQFPRSLYDNIQKILLQYFRIDEELLSRGLYDSDSCKHLLCLRGILDENARQTRYNILHIAREKFLRYTFHAQFKAALVDLKRSTYTPAPTGQAYGTFKLHSHAKRSRTEEPDD